MPVRGNVFSPNVVGQLYGNTTPPPLMRRGTVVPDPGKPWSLPKAGLSAWLGGPSQQLAMSSIGSAVGAPGLGLLVGTGLGLQGGGYLKWDGYTPSWNTDPSKAQRRARFGVRSVGLSFAGQAFLGMSPLEGTVFGTIGSAAYGTANALWKSGTARSVGSSVLEAGSLALSAPGVTLAGAAGLGVMMGGGRSMAEGAIENIAPGAMLMGAGAMAARIGYGQSTGLGALLTHPWGRMGALGGAALASQFVGPGSAPILAAGAIGGGFIAGRAFSSGFGSGAVSKSVAGGVAAAGSFIPKSGLGMFAAFTGASLAAGLWGALSGSIQKGMSAQIQEDEYGSFSSGMGRNYANSGNMALASHYAHSSYARR